MIVFVISEFSIEVLAYFSIIQDPQKGHTEGFRFHILSFLKVYNFLMRSNTITSPITKRIAIKAWINEVIILLWMPSKASSGATNIIKNPHADRTIVHITRINPNSPGIANPYTTKPPLYE
jgi:hypothetical protein